MIKNFGKVYILETENTSYVMKVLDTGHIEHLYYGAKIAIDSEAEAEALSEKHEFQPGNVTVYDKEHTNLTLEDVRLEMSSYGKGDIREPFIEIVYGDGSRSSDFVFESAEVSDGRTVMESLPCAYEEVAGDVSELKIVLKDNNSDVKLELFYDAFGKRDVITRRAKLINNGCESVRLERLMSCQIDFEPRKFNFTAFGGAWAREMEKHVNPVVSGKYVNSSFTGSSSSRANPFVMLSDEDTSEDSGVAYGINLIYSGNHYECTEVSAFGKIRFISGINPHGFSYLLEAGEAFETPEAVLGFSEDGFNGLSHVMHDFVRNCVIRGEWKGRTKPVLLNSWEANYFKIDEGKLLKLAKTAAKVGVELFVMDDGWFGKRNADDSSLGDWYVNKKKLPDGLKGISKKINELGLDFGIWVEPEMVNTDSDLYRTHPDWVMDIPDKAHSEGRNQRVLDLANPEVVDYLEERMSEVFEKSNAAYVKWDMNRNFSDIYSKYLPKERQGETAHRYICGLLELMKRLTVKFPNILFEGCAAGGNRFDLGILSFFPQIWGSDNTDALCRTHIQEGYSYGYPMECVGAHVSSVPNHQTLRVTPLHSRFAAAAFGTLGLEFNLCDMDKDELKATAKYIKAYKKWRDVLQHGTFYRVRTGNIHEWSCVSPDRKKAVAFLFQELVKANTFYEQLNVKGLDAGKKYHLTNAPIKRKIENFGDLVNTASPIHIKPSSLTLKLVSKFVSMPGEEEDITASGGLIMKAGVKLKQAFGATGYNENTRYFQDFEGRLYLLEEVEEAEASDPSEKTQTEDNCKKAINVVVEEPGKEDAALAEKMSVTEGAALAEEMSVTEGVALTEGMSETASAPATVHFRSTGRCELIGNHTDHQHGRVMACAIDLFMDADVEKTDDNTVTLESEGMGEYAVDLSDTAAREDEKGKTEALIRGMAGALKETGYTVGGFKGKVTSQVPEGSGLSSSAAFEVLIGRIFSGLYNDGKITDEEIAIAGQKAENLYFGKPCGLMDQMAVSVGGMVYIDFKDPKKPVVERLVNRKTETDENSQKDSGIRTCESDKANAADFLKSHGYSICIVNTGGSHADLTDEYASIPKEMEYAANLFGREYLRDVDRDAFEKKMAELPNPSRSFLRAKHFFDENERVELAAKAVKDNDIDTFLRLLNESGISSEELLQNITPQNEDSGTGLAGAIELSKKLLDGNGATRVHGGGFAGTIMAVVPDSLLTSYKDGMEEKYGAGSCCVVSIC